MRENTTHTYNITKVGEINMRARAFPFITTLTFKHLIDRRRAEHNTPESPFFCQMELLEQKLKEAPELLEPIQDMSVLDKHQETIKLLVSPFFPTNPWDTEYKAFGKPYSNNFFHLSRQFEKVIGPKKTFTINQETEDKKSLTLFWRFLYAYKAILATFYQRELALNQPLIHTFPHLQTGLNSYFKLMGYHYFVKVRNLQPIPKIDEATFNHLVANFHDIDLWMEHLPPHYFEFSGFTYYNFVDVSPEEATARLEHILLSNHGDFSARNVNQLQQELRILLRLPNIRLGITTFQDYGKFKALKCPKCWDSLITSELEGVENHHLKDSIYEKVLKNREHLVIENLENLTSPSWMESALIKAGVKNIALIPLCYQEKLIGLLEVTSTNPGDVNTLSTYKLMQVVPYFSRAAHEKIERLETRIQALVKKHYTAIHPTVEWRFRKAAIRHLNQQNNNTLSGPEAIVFEEVYPLYGAADIRGSSRQRNLAIRDDLLEHLLTARQLLQQVKAANPLDIIGELDFTIVNKILDLRRQMSPGEESTVIDFILQEVNPFFLHLYQQYPSLHAQLEPFMEKTDTATSIFCDRRKAYESSLKLINETISDQLQNMQKQLQEQFPHYFEKYQTDGVEYNMYIGQSLVHDQEFDLVYLDNLRLKQLIVSCEVARVLHELKDQMAVPLDVTQLILVHSAPINIRFRMEEKQFDVEGAYNIRYEIMKKRIDKATIKGSEERVTQPGQIAIIYTLDKDAEEYARYLKYLRYLGLIKADPEYLELNELPGVQGLKAIRVQVDLEAESSGIIKLPELSKPRLVAEG